MCIETYQCLTLSFMKVQICPRIKWDQITCMVVYLAQWQCCDRQAKYVIAGLITQRTDLGTILGLCVKVKSSEFRHVCYRINILSSQLSPSSINLIPAQAGKVTIGLESHWPCITDTVVYLPTGSTAKDREMSTHSYAPLGSTLITLITNYLTYVYDQ